ncbi:cytochrome P450 [Phytohabitans houttuyneae]|uniref:Cytochrome P450 n=1 Tax=Phytohabitans houttuyneae TaxID=1076126 RepID=A0A6V8JZT0_9ACTN|nr:cytochrome P450 [Phytohabitans houttuyneae]GFJ76824.1 cytochrome P450 [Phytohabitans houttuyneae]
MPAGTRTMGPREAVAALVSPEGRRDPYPLYEVIRAHGGLVAVKPGLMVAVGYAECDEALRETRLRVQDGESYDQIYPAWRAHSSLRAYTDSMLYRNPPDHTRMRRLVSHGFAPRRVEALRGPIERVTDRLLDRMAELGADGPVDFIAEFASRLPIAVISELLGVPERDQAWFRDVAARITIALEGITNVDRLAVADTAMDELAAYFDDLVARRRAAPADDVASALVQAHDTEGERLSRDELIGNMMLMLTAGFETTSFLLGHALLIALRTPAHAARLRGEPGFATGYVEETLRFEPPVQATSRWAGSDVPLAGQLVPAGTKLVIMLAAGNRDPRRFAHPDRFDPDRPPFVPLSLGAGGHFCLGAPLSRMEARIALPRLLRRFPDMAVAGEPVRRDTWIGRGLDLFPVAVG